MIIDMHCDTIQKMKDENLNFLDDNLSVNLKKMQKSLPYIQCLGTFVHPKYNIKNGGIQRALEIINNFYKTYDENKLFLIKSKNDFYSKELEKKPGAILTIENGSAISSDLKNIEVLYQKGIRIMSVVWNQDNELASGALTTNDKGLTHLGKQYVKKLQNMNIVVDVSHMSEKSFYDTIKISNKPIIATHSCCYNLCNHQRNLKDDQIKCIADAKGVIGVCFYRDFLTKNSKANVKDIVNHIEHIVNLVGIDYVGFGSDFDGIDKNAEPIGINGPDDVYKIIKELKNRGYTDKDIDKISSQNFIRVFS